MVNFFKSEVLENIKVGKFHLLKFKLLDLPFQFQVGQFVVLKVGDAIYRSYSVATLPSALPIWGMIVDISQNGPGSQFISQLKAGDIIQATQPRGIFTLKDDGAKTLVMGATGCGIASIKPMIEETLVKNIEQKVILFWGLRFEEDIFYQDQLDQLERSYPNFQYEIILSKPKEGWSGKRGHITEYILDFVKDKKKNTSLYLCGNGEMISGIVKSCADQGFPCDRIYFEKYY